MNESEFLNRAEADECKRKASKFADLLAQRLKDWVSQNGYPSGSDLARELGFNPQKRPWQSIWRGDCVAEDVKAYAKVFAKTGLSEADPRRLPPRVQTLSKARGQYILKPRAWLEEQWRNWFSAQNGEEPVSVPARKPASTTQKSLGTSVGEQIDRWIEQAAQEFAANVATAFQEIQGAEFGIKEMSTKGGQADVSQLARTYYQALQPFLRLDAKEQRSRLINHQSTRDLFFDILVALDALLTNEKEREEKLERILEERRWQK